MHTLSSQMPMFVHSDAHVVDWKARVSHSDAHVCPLLRSCVSAQMHTLSTQMHMLVHSDAHVVDWTARVSHSDAHVCPLLRSCVSAQMHTSSTQIPMLVHSDHGGQKLHAYHPRAKDTRPHTGDLGNLQVSWLWYLGLAKAIHIHTYVYTVFSTGNLPYLRSYVHIRFWPTLMIMDERMCAWCRSALQAISLFNLHGYWIWVATQLKGTKGTSHSYTQLQNERK